MKKKKESKTLHGGFVITKDDPLAKELRPTPRQKRLLQEISKWQKNSSWPHEIY